MRRWKADTAFPLRKNRLAPPAGGNFSPLLFISLVLPNLVFSGPYFYSTLHLMKWAVALVPVALCGLLAGLSVTVRGTVRTAFTIDGFAVIWLLLLLYVTAQPFWSGLRSPETFFQEWFFFASLWLVYVLCVTACRKRAAQSSFLGMPRKLRRERRLRRAPGSGDTHLPFFILPTPGHYIANTGQQNMFALWLALAA